jgi:hypothetical protein
MVTKAQLDEVLTLFTPERRLVGRARARLVIMRGMPRLARLLKSIEHAKSPVDVRREGLRILEVLSGGDLDFEEKLLETARR